MKRQHWFTFALAALMLSAPAAHASSVGVVGVLDFANFSSTKNFTTGTTPSPATGGTSLGFGGFLRGDDALTFELGVLYVPRKISGAVTGTGASTDITFNTLEIPVLLRFQAIPLLSLGFGAYYGYRLGDPSLSAGGTVPAFNRHDDYGLMAAAGFEFPFGPAGLLAEARYVFGLRDQSADNTGSLYWRNWEVVAGVKFGF